MLMPHMSKLFECEDLCYSRNLYSDSKKSLPKNNLIPGNDPTKFELMHVEAISTRLYPIHRIFDQRSPQKKPKHV